MIFDLVSDSTMASGKTSQVENDWREKQLERAKWLKRDLDAGKGWTRRHNVANEYDSWSKTFSDDDVPVKMLYQLQNLPMSIEKFAEMMHPSKLETRNKWENTGLITI